MTGPGTGTPLGSRRNRLREFWHRVYQKSSEDNVFFMAGVISYNLLIAVIPLFLLMVGLWGYVLRARYGDPSEVIVRLLENYIPVVGGDIDLVAELSGAINGLVASRAGYSVVGSLLFIWLATRLVSTLRLALREVFDIAADRGVLKGKLFDIQFVVIGGVLLLLNVLITVIPQSIGGWGAGLIGVPEDFLGTTQRWLAALLAFASIWTLFALNLLVRAGPTHSMAHRVACHIGHGPVLRSDEVGVRVVRDFSGRLSLGLWESYHLGRVVLLVLLRIRSVYPERRNRPGIHHAQSAKSANPDCLGRIYVRLAI